MTWIDISMPLSNETPGWPGDTPFNYELAWTKEQSGSVNVGKLEMSTHIGTHIDAPYHFDNEGRRILDLKLETYTGKAVVIDVSDKERISKKDISRISLDQVNKVLLRTGYWKDRSQFPSSIPCLDLEAVQYLASHHIELFGIDLPSVDVLDSKELPVHHSLQKNGIHILEGLVLDHVQEGVYELIALPLPLKEGDGSPVRAVLRQI